MTADATPTLDFWHVLDLIGQQFPQFLPFLSEDGIFDVFKQAVDPATSSAWSPERIQSAITQTGFFKNTTAAQRSWYILDVTDPSTAAQKKAEATTNVNQVAEQLGVHLTPYDQAIIALNTAVNGWNSDRVKMELVAKQNGAATLGPGGIGDQMTTFKGLAAQQGVAIHDNDLYWWAANAQAGNVDPKGYNNYLYQQAKNLYPALTPALDEGQTVAQFAAPYLATAAQELGINPNQIDLLNPKWMDVVLGKNDKGEQTVLNSNESLQKVRTDPVFGYNSGTPGVTAAANWATTLRQQLGMQG